MRMSDWAAVCAAALVIVSFVPTQAVAQVHHGESPAPLGQRPAPLSKRSPFAVSGERTGAPTLSRMSPTSISQPAQPRNCRAGRRALIGAVIGAGASVPLAKLAHDRFENEAASGPKAAATAVLLSAGAGALIGLATCR